MHNNPGRLYGCNVIRTHILVARDSHRHRPDKKVNDRSAEVYGYKDDAVRYGDEFCQIAKVLVSGPDGRKILLVPLNKTSRPYPLNSSVKIRTYKDFAKITKFTLV